MCVITESAVHHVAGTQVFVDTVGDSERYQEKLNRVFEARGLPPCPPVPFVA